MPEQYEVVATPTSHKGGPRPMPPRYIILHATAGTDSLAWLTGASQPPVSCHILIRKDGHVYRLVPDYEEAWHAGYGYLGQYRPDRAVNLNRVSLGLELENLNTGQDPYPMEQVDSCARVIARWFGLYGNLGIQGHAWVDNRKSDPAGFDWDLLYDKLAYYLRYPHLLD